MRTRSSPNRRESRNQPLSGLLDHCIVTRSITLTMAFVMGLVWGCSGSDSTSTSGGTGGGSSGGLTGSGGTTGASGSAATGGTNATGGSNSSGGVKSRGGSLSTGGSQSTGGASASAGNTSTGGTKATGGTTGAAGSAATGGATSAGGSTATGGSKTNGGASSTGGSKATGGASSTGGTTTVLDCGPQGWVLENHGPPANRVNYVILADGYQTADLVAGGTFETHINNAMTERFSALGQPYSRYRNFVNICAIKIVSSGAVCSGNDAFNCCGDDTSRLATCDNTLINTAFNALPASLSTDWHAVVLNDTSWWNTGAATMLWSGGNTNGPKAALHEGGHGFHQLADEYCASTTGTACGANTNGTGATGTEYAEVDSTGTPATTAGKWDQWMGYNQANATGVQGTFQGSRYVDTGQYRPSGNSKMNSLFGNDPNTSWNSVSQEQIVMTVWRFVKPIDSTVPAAGSVTSPGTLTVNVIDPAVIAVDWTVDGTTTVNGGTTYDTSALASGTHTITAKAYDNATTDLVRYRSSTCPTAVTGNYCSRTAWANSSQSVTWTFTK